MINMTNKGRALSSMGGISINCVLTSYAYMAITMSQTQLIEVKGISLTQFSLFFSFYTLGGILSNMILARIIKKYPIKNICCIGSLGPLIALGGLAFADNLYLIYALGIIGGITINLTGMTVNAVIANTWLNRGRGKLAGFFQSGRSVIGMFMSPLLATIITARGPQSALITIGVGMTAVMLFSSIVLISNLPSYYNMEAADFEFKKAKEDKKRDVATGYDAEMPIKNFFKLPITYVYFGIIILFTLSTSMYTAYQSPILMNVYGVELTQASYCTSAGSIVNIFLATAFGALVDKIGARKGFLGMCTAVPIVFGVLPLILGNLGLTGCLIYAMLAPVYQQQLFTGSLLVPYIFGAKKGAELQPYAGILQSLTGIVAAPIAASLITSTGSYYAILLAFAVLYAVAGIFIAAATSQKMKNTIVKADKPYIEANQAEA